MPPASIRSDLRNLDLVGAARLKPVWGVSMAAIIKRAYDLGTITQSTYRRLFTALNARGMRTREPLEIPFEQPMAFNALVATHRTEFKMTDAELRVVLFTDKLGPRPIQEEPPHLRLTGGSLFS
jgi:Zn-dependent peptidase ImmA (M78 family)